VAEQQAVRVRDVADLLYCAITAIEGCCYPGCHTAAVSTDRYGAVMCENVTIVRQKHATVYLNH
jgi:hypothetical protein